MNHNDMHSQFINGTQYTQKEVTTMSRVSNDEYRNGILFNGYDYTRQAWGCKVLEHMVGCAMRKGVC